MNNQDFINPIEGGLCWNKLTSERMQDSKALEPYGYKVYSQNDEDGIIHEIFERIGTTNKRFVEFGVQDGLESNGHLLLFYGWKGLWIEGSPEYCMEINKKFKPTIGANMLTVINAFIDRDNINDLIRRGGMEGEIDLLSVDIDGNDLYVWDAIDCINPRVVITEYNGKFPPDLEWCQAYDKTHIWRGSDWHGASLKALENLGRKKGYQLVGTNLRGCNAFFVRNDLVQDKFIEPATAEALYNPLRLHLVFEANHPARYCLAYQKENMGLLNYEDYDLVDGFHQVEKMQDGQEGVWTSGCKSILRLPVSSDNQSIVLTGQVMQEALEAARNYTMDIAGSGIEKSTYTLKNYSFSFEIKLDKEKNEDNFVEIEMTIPITVCPSALGVSADTRNLGIYINLSAIEYK